MKRQVGFHEGAIDIATALELERMLERHDQSGELREIVLRNPDINATPELLRYEPITPTEPNPIYQPKRNRPFRKRGNRR